MRDLAKARRTAFRYQLKVRFGLTVEEYKAMHAEQLGRCAICEVEIHLESVSGRARAGVDHDHGARKVRGLLCGACNMAIGQFRDDPRLLEKAARYLRLENDRPEIPVHVGFGGLIHRPIDPNSTKKCTGCGIVKSVSEFYVRAERKNRAPTPTCKTCQRERAAAYRAKGAA